MYHRWQIDNELNCEKNVFYSESDSAAFRTFLQEKYGTLDVLNEAWGNCFLESDVYGLGAGICTAKMLS